MGERLFNHLLWHSRAPAAQSANVLRKPCTVASLIFMSRRTCNIVTSLIGREFEKLNNRVPALTSPASSCYLFNMPRRSDTADAARRQAQNSVVSQ